MIYFTLINESENTRSRLDDYEGKTLLVPGLSASRDGDHYLILINDVLTLSVICETDKDHDDVAEALGLRKWSDLKKEHFGFDPDEDLPF